MGITRKLASLPYAALIFQEGRIKRLNPRAETFLGTHDSDETDVFWSRLDPADEPRVQASLAETDLSRTPAAVQEVRLLSPDGAMLCCDLLLLPLRLRKKPAVQVILLEIGPDPRVRAAMNELTAALAGVADLNQTLAAALVELRSLIHYDRAGLYLLDENERYVLSDRSRPGPVPSQSVFLHNDAILNELRRTKRPLAVADIQKDKRFKLWPDIQSLHGWIGAPLVVGGEVIGFLSLGSLEPKAYSPHHAALLETYLTEVARVLERASDRETPIRRPDELDVLSNFSIALGQAEGQEKILASTMDHVLSLSGAEGGAYFLPDITESVLVVHSSTDDSLIGQGHPFGQDPLWQAFETGQIIFVEQLQRDWKKISPVLRLLFTGMPSVAILPLRTEKKTFGVFCFTFPRQRHFTGEDLNLLNAIIEIAAGSLERVVALESLEAKVQARTRHLSTLYTINTLAGEALDLQIILDRVLGITLEAMGNTVAAIHLLEEASAGQLALVSQYGIPTNWSGYLETLQADDAFWSRILETNRPVLVPDIRDEPGFPEALQERPPAGAEALISTAIRAKGQLLGILTGFGPDVVQYSTSELTLFSAIADQIGMFVERSRLILQAEQAAVLEERQRLARELHDSVTQLLYSQVLFAGAGLKVLEQGDMPLTEHYLARIDGAALQALKEMRLLVYELGPPDQMQDGLVSALRRRLEAVEKRAGVEARLESSENLDIEETLEMALFQIAQEALNNSLKHSGANTVEVHILQENGNLRMSIEDNGCGFNIDEKKESGGMGLKNMAARAEEQGAAFLIKSSINDGTIVQIYTARRAGASA